MVTNAKDSTRVATRRGQTLAAMSVIAVAASAMVLSAVSTAGAEKSSGASSVPTATLHAQMNDATGVSESELVWIDGIDPALGQSLSVQVPYQGDVYTIDLEPHSVRAEGYQVFESGVNGELFEVEPGPVRTLRGEVRGMPGSIAAGSLTMDGGLELLVFTDDGRRFGIDQVAPRVDGAALEQHIVYDTADLDGPAGTCGWSEEWQLENGDPHDPFIGEGLGGPAGEGTFSCAEIAVDADWRFYLDHGATVASTEARVNLIISTINIQYERDVDITHIITVIVVRTSSAEDPYTSNDAGTLLNQFGNNWNNPPESSFPRDVAHLFTGRSLNGTTIGIASLGTICITGSAYGLAESDCCGSLACATDLSAHELGHNWNAAHCNCAAWTMNASLATCNNQFNPTLTIPTISGFRNSRTCLDECAGATTELPFIDDFVTTSFIAGWVGVNGVVINGDGINEPSAPFSMDVSGNSVINTARIDASELAEFTLSYSWQRTGGGNSPEPGEDLIVEYEDANFNWVEITRHLGDGPDQTQFNPFSTDLPPGAFHSGFRLRFRNTSPNPGFDNFFVDNFRLEGIVAATNNDCDAALLAIAGVPAPFTTLGATTDGLSENGACGFNVENDIWYRHFAACEGTLTVDISGSDYDHAVAVYDSFSCPTGANEAIACFEAPVTSIDIPVTAGQALRIRIGGVNDDEGSGTLTLTCDDTPVGCDEDCSGNDDDMVNTVDLLALLAQWGAAGGSCDFDGGGVAVADLLQLLAAWGDCN